MTNVRRNGSSWVAGGRVYQPIAWDKPKALFASDNVEPETYVIRYKKTTPITRTINIDTNTTETSFVLILPLPQQAVAYTVTVAGVAGTERGNYSDELTLHYSSTYVLLSVPACIGFKCLYTHE